MTFDRLLSIGFLALLGTTTLIYAETPLGTAFTYQGQLKPSGEPLTGEGDNRFTLRTSKPNTKASWQVTGIRQDPWASANRPQVEEQKSTADSGTYMHPEAYGQRESKGLQARQMAGHAGHKPQDALRK